MVSRRAGWWHGVAAFGLWGLLPVFWKQIDWLGADQVVVLRAVCCVPLLLLVLAWRGRLGVVGAALRRPRGVGLQVSTAALLG